MNAVAAMTTAGQGFVMMLSLIVVIGAQNTLLLRQGIARSHVTWLVAICGLSDLALVAIGVSGVGAVVGQAPWAMTMVRLGGALVLFGYAGFALRRAVRGQMLDVTAGAAARSRLSVITTCLAITWLNPHVYLDTVVMVGAVANTHGSAGRWWFGAGAVTGSLAWFAALGRGARLLRPLFRRPRARRIMDAGIAAIMIGTGLRLIAG